MSSFSFPSAVLFAYARTRCTVGSGKSTLLLSLLGETNKLSGASFLPSPVVRSTGIDPAILTDTAAYCSQSPWLLSDTIQANIVFGSPLNERRYQAVLDACALQTDLKQFELGDATEGTHFLAARHVSRADRLELTSVRRFSWREGNCPVRRTEGNPRRGVVRVLHVLTSVSFASRLGSVWHGQSTPRRSMCCWTTCFQVNKASFYYLNS